MTHSHTCCTCIAVSHIQERYIYYIRYMYWAVLNWWTTFLSLHWWATNSRTNARERKRSPVYQPMVLGREWKGLVGRENKKEETKKIRVSSMKVHLAQKWSSISSPLVDGNENGSTDSPFFRLEKRYISTFVIFGVKMRPFRESSGMGFCVAWTPTAMLSSARLRATLHISNRIFRSSTRCTGPYTIPRK